jgi:monomeric sarcosine oxidase
MPNAPRMTRRTVLAGMAAAAGCAALEGAAAKPAGPSPGRHDVIVIGAGVFGSWTAWQLLRLGKKVLLLDAWGPAHARSSSGGESRMTRTVYGADDIYTRFAWESLDEWRWLSTRAGLPIFHPAGVLFSFASADTYVTRSIEVHRQLNIPLQTLDRATLVRRFPQAAWDGVEVALYEPDRGALMARRAVQTLVQEFVAAGGEYRQASIVPPQQQGPLDAVATAGGEKLHAQQFVFACGPWLPKLFPALLGTQITPTRQEVFFFAPAAGDTRYAAGALPGWADFDSGDIYYGFPDLEARGFKIAHDRRGARIDPDIGDRSPSAEALADVRRFMHRRFPALAQRPLVEARVCQYENSANGDLLIDRHPDWENVCIVGAGSGHGFKHGPAVGRYTAQLVTGQLSRRESRFNLR